MFGKDKDIVKISGGCQGIVKHPPSIAVEHFANFMALLVSNIIMCSATEKF